MQISREDLGFLYDIYVCSESIKEFTKGMKYYHFSKDKKTISAVERQFEIIGIAANKLSKEVRDLLSHIPWGQLVGFRNLIAHEYRDIRIEKMWVIIKDSLVLLRKELKKIEDLKPYIKKT